MAAADLTWRKSSYSNPHDCVEVAWPAGRVAVRDSKNMDGPTLCFSRATWALVAAWLRR